MKKRLFLLLAGVQMSCGYNINMARADADEKLANTIRVMNTPSALQELQDEILGFDEDTKIKSIDPRPLHKNIYIPEDGTDINSGNRKPITDFNHNIIVQAYNIPVACSGAATSTRFKMITPVSPIAQMDTSKKDVFNQYGSQVAKKLNPKVDLKDILSHEENFVFNRDNTVTETVIASHKRNLWVNIKYDFNRKAAYLMCANMRAEQPIARYNQMNDNLRTIYDSLESQRKRMDFTIR